MHFTIYFPGKQWMPSYFVILLLFFWLLLRILPYRCRVVPLFYLFKPSSQTNFNSLKTVRQQNSIFYKRRKNLSWSFISLQKSEEVTKKTNTRKGHISIISFSLSVPGE